jgi:Ca2+-binding EF-hand superfamily protein
MSGFDNLLREKAALMGVTGQREDSGDVEDGTSSLVPVSVIEYVLEHPQNNRHMRGEENENAPNNSIYERIRRRTILDTVECRKSAVSEKIFEEISLLFKDCEKTDYKDFARRADQVLSPDAAAFFKGSIFQKFNVTTRVPIVDVEEFLRNIQREIDVEMVYLDLLVHAADPHCITETELENFLFQYIPRIGVLMDMPDAFKPYYSFTAVRKFFFVLDERRTQSISIAALAESPVMEEFLFLMRLSQSEAARQDVKTFDAQLMGCWFSLESTMAIYNGFLDLDTDQSGMLSESEMSKFQGCGLSNTIRRDIACQFTGLAVHRIFQETVVYEPSTELDYKRYVDCVLAVEGRGTPASSQYFFRLLDVDHIGKLTVFSIRYFYADVRKLLLSMGVDCPTVDNVVREILDMMEATSDEVRDGITLPGLVASGHGHIILDMLLDVNSFWRYDNRESLMNHPPAGSSS